MMRWIVLKAIVIESNAKNGSLLSVHILVPFSAWSRLSVNFNHAIWHQLSFEAHHIGHRQSARLKSSYNITGSNVHIPIDLNAIIMKVPYCSFVEIFLHIQNK
jgi:hypothetical protein